ncbi:MAG: GGDEF domain-containing protein [Nitrosomonas sp.]|nr:MAG: GGDEF domain-containing protein [Nitrosomonas sp.]
MLWRQNTLTQDASRFMNATFAGNFSSDNSESCAAVTACSRSELFSHLNVIIEQRQLTPNFQPIVSMANGGIFAYEGLIRGPSNSALHSPLSLFRAAAQFGLLPELERLCRQVTLEAFVRLKLVGKLFLNVSPVCLLDANFKNGETLDFMAMLGLEPHRVVIELTENQPTYDYSLLFEAVRHYRSMGFEIAIDDLGEGFSSLRLWFELNSEYVKIDQHFIQNINQDPIKLQFVRSIQQIAENSGTQIIAEGIETHAECMIVKDLDIALGQGYFIARPNANPATMVSTGAANSLQQNGIAVYPRRTAIIQKNLAALKLLTPIVPVTPGTDNDEVYRRFHQDAALESLPVVEHNVPIGIICRNRLIDAFARPYWRELYGKKACTLFMDAAPLVVDKNINLQELSNAVVSAGQRHLSNGFIITDRGQYLGMGTGHELMREITQLQITAARYANPLTLLPGNVPIDEHIDRLLESRIDFCVGYCDLDAFKPFNDIYGYRKGDEVIQLTGMLLAQMCDLERDFLGHIGGDDFIILFQSADWELRCREMLGKFTHAISHIFRPIHREQGGYYSIDRKGKQVFHSLITLSIGAVLIAPGVFTSHHEIASVATAAKRQAKRIAGNSLFIERRNYGIHYPDRIGAIR